MLRASMQVLIKIIQKRGASSFVWRCGTGSFRGLASFPHPCALRRFCLVSTFYRWAARLHLCTSTSGEATGSKRGRGLRGTQSSIHLPSLHPCHPKPSRLSLTGEVINFIYTLIRLSDESLSLWIVGVKGLWGSSEQPLLRFSCLIATQLGSRQNRLGDILSQVHQYLQLSNGLGLSLTHCWVFSRSKTSSNLLYF